MATKVQPLAAGTYTVSSGFGARWGTTHYGQDYACAIGTPLYAVADGTVVEGKERPQGSVDGFGSWIWLDCQASIGQDIIYGHVDHAGILVQAGDRVTAGQIIGCSGNEGASTGPHCHVECWSAPGRLGGAAHDPAVFFADAAEPGAATEPSTGGSPAMTIFGIDVSEHQDGMSLAQAKREGMSFAFIRTTDGTYRDSCYRSHLDDAEGAGLITAAYHFCRRPDEGTSVAQQVQASLDVMGDKVRPLWLDVETPGGFSGDLVAQFKAEFERRGVRVVGVYSYVPYWEGQMAGGEPDTHQFGKLWVAGYPSTRTGAASAIYESIGGDGARQWDYPLGNQQPSIWQLTDRATVAGHQVDANAFRGSEDALRTLINGGEAANSEEEITVAEADRIIKHIEDFIAGFCGPIGSDTKDIREQLTGGRDAGQYPGWNVGSILNAARRKSFRALTSMEIQAVLLAGTKDDIKAARAAAQEQ